MPGSGAPVPKTARQADHLGTAGGGTAGGGMVGVVAVGMNGLVGVVASGCRGGSV